MKKIIEENMKKIIGLLLIVFSSYKNFAQQGIITDDIYQVIEHVEELYKKENYTIAKKIVLPKPIAGKDSIIKINCYSGKKILVVAVFDKKPVNDLSDSKFIINQKMKAKIVPQSFNFPLVSFNAALNTYYALLQLQFPTQAHESNCFCELKAMSKEANGAIGFIVMVK
jgi:hypothetical protein